MVLRRSALYVVRRYVARKALTGLSRAMRRSVRTRCRRGRSAWRLARAARDADTGVGAAARDRRWCRSPYSRRCTAALASLTGSEWGLTPVW